MSVGAIAHDVASPVLNQNPLLVSSLSSSLAIVTALVQSTSYRDAKSVVMRPHPLIVEMIGIFDRGTFCMIQGGGATDRMHRCVSDNRYARYGQGYR